MNARLFSIRRRCVQHGQPPQHRWLRIGSDHHPGTALLREMHPQQTCQPRGFHTRRQNHQVTRQLAFVRLDRSHPGWRAIQPEALHLGVRLDRSASGSHLPQAGPNGPGRIDLSVVGTQGAKHEAIEPQPRLQGLTLGLAQQPAVVSTPLQDRHGRAQLLGLGRGRGPAQLAPPAQPDIGGQAPGKAVPHIDRAAIQVVIRGGFLARRGIDPGKRVARRPRPRLSPIKHGESDRPPGQVKGDGSTDNARTDNDNPRGL